MEEKENKEKISKKTEDVKGFKAVQNPNTYKDIYKQDSKPKVGFGKSILLPFFSGIVGCGLVLRYMFWSSFNPFTNTKRKQK